MKETIEKLRAFPARLTAALEDVDESDRRRPEGPDKWSVADVVAHLCDLELIHAVRLRTIVAGADDTPLPAIRQNDWVARVHGHEQLGEILGQLRFLRRMNVAFVSRLNEEEMARSGRHPHAGPMTVQEAMERMATHDAKHLAQIERIKTAIQSV